MTAGMAMAVILAAGCGRSGGGAASRQFTDDQLKARFAYDLGPATIDVSAYPVAQQKNYELFAQTCAGCHTLARPINAPLFDKASWGRFAQRMHAKSQGHLLTKQTYGRIVEFLAFDSVERKVKHRDAYLAQLRGLYQTYAQVELERARVQVEEGERLARNGYTSP